MSREEPQEMDMVRRMSRAIVADGLAKQHWRDLATLAEHTEAFKDSYRDYARSALRALLEPTQAMIDAGNEEIPDNVGFANDAAAVFKAMISAALK